MTTKLDTADRADVNELIDKYLEKLESLSAKVDVIAQSPGLPATKARAFDGLSRLVDSVGKLITDKFEKLVKPHNDEIKTLEISFSPVFYKHNRLKTRLLELKKENRVGGPA